MPNCKNEDFVSHFVITQSSGKNDKKYIPCSFRFILIICSSSNVLKCIFNIFLQVLWVAGHGMLKLPRSRVSAWRKQGCCEAPNPKVWENGWFNTPAYYDDNGSHCGGKHFDLVTPKTCNICGGRPETKTFMAPGEFATGTITGQYKSGGTIKLEYEATANHIGYFLVKLCTNVPSKSSDPPQSCFDRYVQYSRQAFYIFRDIKVLELT